MGSHFYSFYGVMGATIISERSIGRVVEQINWEM